MISKILIAVDDHIFADAIEELLGQLKWEEPPTMKVIHVIEPVEAMAKWPSEVYREESLALISKTAEKLRQRYPEITVDEELLEGYITDEIIDQAINWKADLILIGSHGRRGIRRFTLGSVSQQVVSNAPCSVVVVRQLNPIENDQNKPPARMARIARD